MGSGSNESIQGRLFGGDDIGVKATQGKYGLTLPTIKGRNVSWAREAACAKAQTPDSVSYSEILKNDHHTVDRDICLGKCNSSENTG